MMLKLVQAALDDGFYDELEAKIAKSEHLQALPAVALEKVRKLCGIEKDFKRESISEEDLFEEITLQDLMRLIRSAIENGNINDVQKILQRYKRYVSLIISNSLANDIKTYLGQQLKTGHRVNRETPLIVMSICDSDPPTDEPDRPDPQPPPDGPDRPGGGTGPGGPPDPYLDVQQCRNHSIFKRGRCEAYGTYMGVLTCRKCLGSWEDAKWTPLTAEEEEELRDGI